MDVKKNGTPFKGVRKNTNMKRDMQLPPLHIF